METNLNAGVYCIINTINNKKYAGSSIDIKNRWREHKNKLRRGRHENPYLQREFNKYGEDAFDFRVLVYTDPDEALPLEQFILDNYFDLFEYNISRDATAPMFGREHSEETKQKMSEAQRGENGYWFGKHHTDETRRKMSDGHKGKVLSDETKQKMSKAHIGKTFSEETKQKMSEAKSGENHPNFGKTRSEKTLAKMSEAQSGDKSYRWIDIPDEEIIKMKCFREQGYSYQKIAKIFGISHPTVRNRLNNMSSATPIKQEVSREANL